MNLRKRRQCCVLGQSLLFKALQYSNQRICDKYTTVLDQNTQEGIKMLKNLTEQYINSRRKDESISLPTNFTQENLESITSKKELVDEIEANEPKRYYSFDQKTELKNNVKPQTGKKRLTEAEELKQSLNKLHIDEKEEDLLGSLANGYNEVDQNNNFMNHMEQLQQKTIQELIQESNQKIIKNRSMRQQDNSSDQSYPITDYSSNQSSNQNSYDEEYKDQELQMRGDTYKSVGSLSVGTQSSIGTGYNASKLMYSPKKSKSKSKARRLYIRDKKIPRWAQDMKEVMKIAAQQKNNPEFNFAKIYGVCVVEKLDTNVIFQRDEIYMRGSSARWNRHPYSQFESMSDTS